MNRPFPQSYWVKEGLFCAGQFPADVDPAVANEKLRGLVACGIERVINLIPSAETGWGGAPFVDYIPKLEAIAKNEGRTIVCERIGFPDASIPAPEVMTKILDVIDGAIEAGNPVYLHCWGGHGRTGTVVACHLIRHGMDPVSAVRHVVQLRQGLPKSHFPFEGEQEAFVLRWRS